ncbi:5-dehydro-4-deoxy-D-glucuronate isomerase [Elizabethkingia meningoseptica]|uniref:5-dehydro-4-deoxy-D-glucuronate isomerase n=1 Tax=Elizabethkingia meningoseptica TaxID=238 RepID=UPI0022F17801|nr:5-dehydro-4-deoxy-D-glucuronate isomerase [Elizabethkingia meningoseptica]EJK5327977.1 5-dehydro-4-deoxy-D-glucuronate isomerase [Elizabethkingia meningoseptica]MDE5466670.1 5-dehydro-4-deoxy-D-glucuronate isomerase [Elizabethkingia meningoseptica]MDE5474100.1 5-dehydro-4-deoxy-D-glucuronate isomerase [Elizabethkingia meningoseptica]MDE5477533.1 5-dehydro-4-deoxy-D-glucuronate isomerase [Elizabethkingia meningoseptica]MDE5483989.1 5-dehydro-4-deoxy-D-glucuronate isomerase [Elizabethkingia m
MQIRFESSPREVKAMDTTTLRQEFLVKNLIHEDRINLTYSHYDRLIIGGAKPVSQQLKLETHEELKADFFLQRRELGIINVGGKGSIEVDGEVYSLEKLDCLYVGKGAQHVTLSSEDHNNPAMYYLLSSPAHHEHPTTKYTKEQAAPVMLGDSKTSNRRTIYKYIHEAGIQSCQLVMGLTVLDEGSVWNSVPPHTHTRRTEVYFYFDLPDGQKLFHMMGEPEETRHIIMKNHEAVISPSWSVHFGAGTSNYGFIWGMAGENKRYDDMDPAPLDVLL